MANDKDFLLKNAVEVGGPTKVTLGTVTANNVDLSTGNYFADTPSGTSTYTFSNAGNVQSFQIEVTGGTAEVAQNFSTTLYTGTGTTQTITNGIDLAGEGGLVWSKARSATQVHTLFDTERGATKSLFSNLTNGEITLGDALTGFTSSGYTLGADASGPNINGSGSTYVSWTFKKEPSFFDVVTWTGDGTTGRAIPHNLGVEPGCILLKVTSTSTDWYVFHRSLNGGTNPYVGNLRLNNTGSEEPDSFWVQNPTDTNFYVKNSVASNQSGQTYVAYLFAHDDAADGLIQCGGYTGTGSTQAIDLGWEPQWLLLKRTNNVGGSWYIMDLERGFTTDSNPVTLKADSSDAEGGLANVRRTSTGFSVTHDSGHTWIYIAIRAVSDPDITWPASVEWTGGTAPSSPAVGETDVYTFITDDGGTSYVGIQSADNLS